MQKKFIDPKQAFLKAQKYCTYQERSQQEVRDKLYEYGLHRRDVELVISQLITEGFINEERFAIAFAGGKFRIKQWGRNKIKAALKLKKVSDYCINKALNEIKESDYKKALVKIISQKSKLVKEKNLLKKKFAVAQYSMSRGFEGDLVWEILRED